MDVLARGLLQYWGSDVYQSSIAVVISLAEFGSLIHHLVLCED